MNIIKKFMAIMSSQIKGVATKLPTIQKSHKIKDDNQSIHNGVVNEKSKPSLRSETQSIGESKRSAKPKRTT